MSEDWQAGDRAICIHDGGWFHRVRFLGVPVSFYHAKGPRRGQSFKVVDAFCVGSSIYLSFAEWPREAWQAEAFRKAKPDEAKGSRRAWRDLFNRHRRKVLA